MQPKLTLLLVGLVSGMAVAAIAAPASAEDAGKQAFLSNKCDRCHAVGSEGIEATAKSKRMRGPDLGTIGDSRDAEWLVRYIEKEVQANDREHPIAWKGSDEILEAMADWLASLKSS